MNLPDGNKNNQDDLLDAFFAAHVESLLSGQDFNMESYKLSPADSAAAQPLLELAYDLREALQPVAPSDEFVSRLKNELVGEQSPTLLLRWRKLPAHYRMMARLGGLTLGAGITLLAARRALDVLSALHRHSRAETDKGLPVVS